MLIHFYRLLSLLFFINVQSENVTTFPTSSTFTSEFNLRKNFREMFKTSLECPNEPITASERPQNDTSNLTTPEKPSTGNCTNNLTNPNSITSTVPPPETEPSTDEPPKQPIATFDEWTKEKLKQEQKKAVPTVAAPTPVPTPPAPTRNYASRECGAKILLANPEAENTKAILNDKEKDEYMRNPCTKADKKFIVLELCETIQPSHIVLGNFELFSSGPKDIRVSSSERSGADWQPLGNFTAADTRQLQTFTIDSSRQYAKLLKIELLSHYGNEHYCTLSVMKIMGSSMVDEYEYEAHLANHAETVRLPVQVEETVATPALTKPPPTEVVTETPKLSTIVAPPPVEPITMPVPKTEQKRTVTGIVEQVVNGGNILKNIVSVVTNKLAGDKETEKASNYKPFDMSLCNVCPISPSCIVPTHLCWVFVWRPPPRNSTVSTDSLILPTGRWLSERRRRRRIAFHQRQMHEKKHLTASTEPIQRETKLAEDVPPVEEVKLEETFTTSPPVIQPTPGEALPAASISHKESVFMKLNKRIAALELNMSLSSEYLSELSRQYVAQTDEHKKHLEQARKTAQEVAEGVEIRLNQTIAARLSLMRKEMDSLAEWLHSMRMTVSDMSLPKFAWQMPRDKCSSEDTTAMKQYFEKENIQKTFLWTLDEVIILIVSAQVLTVALGGLAFWICIRRRKVQTSSELEKLIQLKIEEMLEKRFPSPSPPPRASSMPSVPKKKRRKRNRPTDQEYPSSDSAVSQTTACQTETSSEAESARTAATQQEMDTTIRPPTPERSEEETPWIPVKR